MNQPSQLSRILDARRRQLGRQMAQIPLQELQRKAQTRENSRDFAAPLARPGLSVIAEIKRASPSRGLIRSDYQPRQIARNYESNGACALSVLTEDQFFRGSLPDLQEARSATNLPTLRKDFIVDEYQIYETAAGGADALLLIVAALDDAALDRFLRLSHQLRLTALVEVHTEAELGRAVDLGTKLIGINNRDLTTLEVSLETSFALRDQIPSDCLAVSESGIHTAEDLARLRSAGFDAVLVGEQLMSAVDPGKELARLLQPIASLPPR